MNKLSITTLEETEVAHVKSESGPAGAKPAFDKLESRMNGLSGRKMYGVFYPEKGEYYASVKLDQDHSDDMGFERGKIPGGKYAKKELRDWINHIREIQSTFKELMRNITDNGYEIDDDRPTIEFYESFRKLICLVPIK